MVYSIAERTEIILIYGEENRCANRAAGEFNRRNPNKNVRPKYVGELVAKFMETGSVANKKRVGPRLLDEGAQIEVLGNFVANPTTSLRQMSVQTGLSVSSCRKVTKLHKFHPYKMKLVQELNEDDFDRRMEFCELMTAKISNNEIQPINICFSDECTFYLNGILNRHNCRYWSDENMHVFTEARTQYPQKLNVWAGILGNKIIGPLFIDGNLTGATYLDMLENTIGTLITDAVNEQRNVLLDENHIYFQQDGAPPHYALPVRQWLDNRFPNKWIGRRGFIEWPARSPDLTSPDFFLWGHLKSIIYKTPLADLEELRHRIIDGCRSITPQTFQKVRESFEARLYHCLANNGQQFEHLL